jgi:hypothetical protein
MKNKIKETEISSNLPTNEVAIGVEEKDNIVEILQEVKKIVRESYFKDSSNEVITSMLDDVTDSLKNNARLVCSPYNSSNSVNNFWCIEDVIGVADDNDLDVNHLKRNDFLQILHSFQGRLEYTNEYAFIDLAEEIENHLDDMEADR